MYILKLFCGVSVLLICFTVNSLEISDNIENPVTAGEIRSSIKEIVKIMPQDYLEQIGDYRRLIEKFIENKRRVCTGEFSTVIVGENREDGVFERLSKDERKICFRELLNIQIKFIDNIFIARKKYLNWTHQDKMKSLQLAHDKSIKNIRDSFKKGRGR